MPKNRVFGRSGGGMPVIILKHYRIVNRNGIFYVISKKPHRCPCCQGPLKVRDSRPRQLILSDETMTFQLRRLKCQNCGALHLEIPDLILPHKHYSREVIENALHGNLLSCPAENSTIYRWSKELKDLEAETWNAREMPPQKEE